MYIQKRKDRSGKVYFSFSYVDENGLRIRLKKHEHPFFTDRTEAETWAKSQLAYRAARKALIERKLAWKTKYYQFDELLEGYNNWHKTRAPNSWETSSYYLSQYAFAFFLGEKHASNINDW